MPIPKPGGLPASVGYQDNVLYRRDRGGASTPSDRINVSLDSEGVFSSKVSHSTQPSTVSRGPSTTSCDKFSKVRLSRVERYALAMIESQAIRLGESESFWVTLSSQGTNNLEDALDLSFPPLFQTLCVCDTAFKGSPIYLSSSKYETSGPRTLDVGAVRFLNLPDLGERCRLLTASPGSDKKPRFHVELVSKFLHAADKCDSGYALVARMDITESILLLARRLLDRYGIGDTDACDKRMTMSPPDGTDWQVAASSTIPAMSDRLACDFRAPVPLGDPDVIEFHRFVEDITWFHRDAFILSPSSETWQITHISEPLASTKDDVRQGLSSNAPAVLHDLGRELAGNDPMSRAICWGPRSAQKRLYCVPMFRRERSCWICFLVESTVPDLWRDLRNSAMRDS